ncbi:glycosyltransferase family A protein [Pseudoclavibacter helvolus]|uniref:glycosyltransferase family 2 protein n=1 Tax=Pseudoclavibacter helvolus TaxID=255205 RepID=UPI0009ED3542
MNEVTVVIPTTGRDSLQRSVDSVKGLAGVKAVIVVVDRHSAEAEVRSLVESGPVRVVLSEWSGAGGSRARNTGLYLVETQFVAFLDDDDYWDRERLSGVLEKIGSRDIVSSQFKFFRPEKVLRVVPSEMPELSTGEQLVQYAVLRDERKFGKTAIQTSSMIMPTSLARTVRWNTDLAKHQDWDFAARLIRAGGRFVWDPRPVVFVEKGSVGSVSKSRNWKSSRDFYLENFNDHVRSRASADFLLCHVFRGAVAQRDLSGMVFAVSALRSVPHFWSVVIAVSGFLKERGS